MAFTITPSDVKAFCPSATAFADEALQIYINQVNQADQCLDTRQVPEDVQQFLKLSGVCHFLTRLQGGTRKTEKSDVLATTWEVYKLDGYGLSSTTFGQNILSSLYADCFAFMDQRPSRYIRSIGR